MVDGFNRLGHYTVISCYYEDCDIRCVRTSHTHCGKGLMSGCIKERDLTSVYVYNISPDGLCDSSCLTLNNLRVSDGIK